VHRSRLVLEQRSLLLPDRCKVKQESLVTLHFHFPRETGEMRPYTLWNVVHDSEYISIFKKLRKNWLFLERRVMISGAAAFDKTMQGV
jgi:hypothetical protein